MFKPVENEEIFEANFLAGGKAASPTNLMLAGTSPHQDLSKYDEGVWVMEEKFDGERVQAIKENGTVRLFSRNKGIDGNFKELTNSAKEIINELSKIESDFHIDGEMIHIDSGLSGEEKCAKVRSRLGTKIQTPEMAADIPLTYVVFDILSYNGKDIRNDSDRRTFLYNITIGLENIVESFVYRNLFKQIYDKIISEGGEGVIVKKRGYSYQNKRSKDWLKVVPEYTEDVVVTGYTRGTGRRESTFGALRCIAPNGIDFKVGTGFNDEMLAKLKQEMDKRILPPNFVIEIGLKGWQPSGRPRQPKFKCLRLDKTENDVRKEQPKEERIISEKNTRTENQKSLFDFEV